MAAEVLLRLNTNRVEVVGLRAATAVDVEEYINDASVGVTITDLDGVEVTGETWPVSLSYEAGSNGNYSANISPLDVAHKTRLLAVLTATSGDGEAYWEIPVVARTRAQ